MKNSARSVMRRALFSSGVRLFNSSQDDAGRGKLKPRYVMTRFGSPV
jgi:hypothetical protein